MREIIVIQCGGMGGRLGMKFYEYLFHQISPFFEDNVKSCDIDLLSRTNVYFQETSPHNLMPRTLIMDTDKEEAENLRSSPLAGKLPPGSIITVSYGLDYGWAQGFFTEGANMLPLALDNIRKLAENCDCFQGFQMIHSAGSGTGGGLGSLLLRSLRDEYSGRYIDTCSKLISEKNIDNIREAYNMTLSLPYLSECADSVKCIDNDSLINTILRVLKITTPTFSDINHCLARSLNESSSFLYLKSLSYRDLFGMGMQLVPYPRTHFLTMSHAPIISRNNYEVIKIPEIASMLFNDNNLMTNTHLSEGRILCGSAFFRSPHRDFKDIPAELARMASLHSIPNFPESLAYGYNSITNGYKYSGAAIFNSTSIIRSLKFQLELFRRIFTRRLFLHFYTQEGMEEQDFLEGESSLMTTIDSYQELEHIF